MASTYSVQVIPDASGWSARLAPQLDRTTRAIADNIREQLSRAVRDGLNGTGVNPKGQGSRTGGEYADAFSRTVKAKLEAAFRALPKIKIDANSSAVDVELAQIRRKLEAAARGLELGIGTDVVEAKVDQLAVRLQALAANNPDIRVQVNTAAALAEIEAFKAAMGRKGKETAEKLEDAFSRTLRTKLTASLANLPKIDIDVNSSNTDRELADVRRKLAAAVRGVELGVDDKLVEARIAELKFRLERLATEAPDIRVRMNAGAALAEITALRVEVDKLDGRKIRVDAKVDVDKPALKLLQTALTLAPAALPLVGGILAAASAAVGVAGVAGLAIAGIKTRADAASTDMVQSQINALQPLVKEWMRVAAIESAPGITAGIRALAAGAPEVTHLVQTLGHEVGLVAEGFGIGLPKALKVLTPLLTSGEEALAEFGGLLAAGPADDGALVKTLDYMSTSLPETIAFLEHLSLTLLHVVEAAAPVGSVMLEIVDGLLQLVSAIPTPALTALITALTAYRLGMFASAVATRAFGASMAGVLGPIGLVLAAVTAIGVAMGDAQSGSDRGLSGFVSGIKSSFTNDDSNQAQIDAGRDPASKPKWWEVSGLDTARSIFGMDGGTSDQVAAAKELKGQIEQLIPIGREAGTVLANIDIGRALKGVNNGGDIKELGQSYDTLSYQLNEYLSTAQQLDGVGQGTQVTIGGNVYALDEYQRAMALSNDDTARAVELMEQNRTAAGRYGEQITATAQLQNRMNEAVGAAAYASKLSTDQVSLYAKAIGITALEVATGAVSNYEFERSIAAVADRLRNANTANQAWLDAIEKFNPATATAADVAGLLSAGLTASRGDLLDYTSTMLAADSATQSLTKSLKDNLESLTQNGALKGVSTVDDNGKFQAGDTKFTEGSSQIAAALSQQTQAATAAAAATYQHEAALKGTQVAAQDAMTVYAGYRQSLIDQAMQSGATAAQAQGLADQYFAMPTDVDTFVKMLGGADMGLAISNLTTALNRLSDLVATPGVDLNDNASARLDSIGRKIVGLDGSSATVYVQTAGGKALLNAFGGIYDSVPAYAQGGITDGLTNKMRASVPHFAGGTENHVPQIALPGGMTRVWAEPETMGEAYIPFNPDRRKRALDIWAQVGQRFGVFGQQPSTSTAGYASAVAGASAGSDVAAEVRALRGDVQAVQTAVFAGATHVASDHRAALVEAGRAQALTQAAGTSNQGQVR